MVVVNENTSRGGTEFLLMSVNQMDFQASAKFLEDRNVFLGDTGASSDTTTLTRGFKNTRKGGSEDNITNVSGVGLKGKLVSNVTGTFYNKHGQGLYDATIKEMVYTPDAGFNLFSITKQLEQGYWLGGDKIQFGLKKDRIKLCLTSESKLQKVQSLQHTLKGTRLMEMKLQR